MRAITPAILVFSLAWTLGPACSGDDSSTTPSSGTTTTSGTATGNTTTGSGTATGGTTTTSGKPTTSNNQWYMTCGDPVCSGYGGPFAGVPLCSDLNVTAGDACGNATGGDSCDPVDACNALLTCTDTDPTQQPGGCPISRAEHKQGIAYLDDAQRKAAANDLLDVKLATWRYRDQLDDGTEHMGFIIDDMPTSAAVRPDGEHVDLYGYTSLAVAAIQEQQRQIAALEARLAELESSCGDSSAK